MTEYDDVNDGVNTVFFSPKNVIEPVYLSLEDDHRAQLVTYIGDSIREDELESYIGNVVGATLDFSGSNIYIRHEESLRAWQRSNMESEPPFSALLLSLALAAESMRNDEVYSANNYYQRLFETYRVTDEQDKARIKFAGKYTRKFWHALNIWLTKYDYAYGKPTAKQVNSWTYVSYALSQSLVRKVDRARFSSLFAKFGLSRNDLVTDQDMHLYLHEWMTGFDSGPWLRRLWETPDLRDRVASAASEELEQWDGLTQGPDSQSRSFRRLSWIIRFSSFPVFKFNLHLVAGTQDSATDPILKVPDRAGRIVKEAFANTSEIKLESFIDSSLRQLGPKSQIKLEALMLTSLELNSNIDGVPTSYRRESRSLITLVKDDTGRYYKEVARLTMHARHIVLCHGSWQLRVKSYLDEFAVQGFEQIDGNIKNGIPADWVLFRNVILSSIPDREIDDQLLSLVPIASADAGVIHMSGGLKLAQNIWHANAPPQVIASDEHGVITVELCTDDITTKSKTLASTQLDDFNPNFISDSGLALDSSNLSVLGIRGRKKIVERPIAFRSAETPRRNASLNDTYSYSLGTDNEAELNGFSANPTRTLQADKPSLRGMLVEGEFQEICTKLIRLQAQELPRYERDEVSVSGFDLSAVESSEEVCVLRGYHHFLCEPYLGPDSGKASRVLNCKDCNLSQIAAKKKSTRNALVKNFASAHSAPTMVAAEDSKNITVDNVLDALCYLGSGTWASAVQVISPLFEDQWRVGGLASDLVDLGMIDLMLASDFGGPVYWSCAPPVLVVTSSGYAVLTGFRNKTLIADVIAALDGVAISYCKEQEGLAPAIHKWDVKGIKLQHIKECMEGVTGPLGRAVLTVESPSLQIASSMPSLSQIASRLKRIDIEDNEEIQKFDPLTGQWHTSELNGVGAYRLNMYGRRYFFHTKEEFSFQTSHVIAKLFAAKHSNVQLHKYDEVTKNFECVLGCNPPGLLKRALVSESGELPLTNKYTHRYKSIPKELARMVLHKMYG